MVAQQGFIPSAYDNALLICWTSAAIILLLFFVDDMIITGNDIVGISALQRFLSQHFEMKNLDNLCYFLGLKVTPLSNGYYRFQAKYAFDLLSKVGPLTIRPSPFLWKFMSSSLLWIEHLFQMLHIIKS